MFSSLILAINFLDSIALIKDLLYIVLNYTHTKITRIILCL